MKILIPLFLERLGLNQLGVPKVCKSQEIGLEV